MSAPGKLWVRSDDGKLVGPASISYNDPFPCPNGNYGSEGIQGVVMHTMVGNLPGTIAVFNNPAYEASAHFGIDQDGHIHQFGPIGKGWIAWAEMAGNPVWYSIEHADDGNPLNPLTGPQIVASAQVFECLSVFAGFPAKEANSIYERGYGCHYMGGEAWGGHSCPQAENGRGPRAGQRADILALVERMRNSAGQPHHYRAIANGEESLEEVATLRHTTPAYIREVTLTSDMIDKANLKKFNAYYAGGANRPMPAGLVYYTYHV